MYTRFHGITSDKTASWLKGRQEEETDFAVEYRMPSVGYIKIFYCILSRSRDSVVGIATSYGLGWTTEGSEFESR
jgi:hypothetical protein